MYFLLLRIMFLDFESGSKEVKRSIVLQIRFSIKSNQVIYFLAKVGNTIFEQTLMELQQDAKEDIVQQGLVVLLNWKLRRCWVLT